MSTGVPLLDALLEMDQGGIKAAAHAPPGGVTIGSQHFPGGQFIPSVVIDHASEAELAKIEGGNNAGVLKPPRRDKNERRSNRLPPPPEGHYGDVGMPPGTTYVRGHLRAIHLLGKFAALPFKALGATVRAIHHGEAWVAHIAKEYVADKVEQNVEKLSPRQKAIAYGVWKGLRFGTRAAFITYTAGQRMAEEVAKAAGANQEQAQQIRNVLSTWDVILMKPVQLTMPWIPGAAPLAIPLSFVPIASTAAICVGVPAAMTVQARNLVKYALGGEKATRSQRSYDVAMRLAHAIVAADGDRWFHALVAAGLDQSGNLEQAIDVARQLYRQHGQKSIDPPKPPALKPRGKAPVPVAEGVAPPPVKPVKPTYPVAKPADTDIELGPMNLKQGGTELVHPVGRLEPAKPKPAPPPVQPSATPTGGPLPVPVAQPAPAFKVKQPRNPGNYPVAKPAQATAVPAPVAKQVRGQTEVELGPINLAGGEEGADAGARGHHTVMTEEGRAEHYAGDEQHARAAEAKAKQKEEFDRKVEVRRQEFARVQAYVQNNNKITPTQKRRMLHAAKDNLVEAEEKQAIVHSWEANPHLIVSHDDAKKSVQHLLERLKEKQADHMQLVEDARQAREKGKRAKEIDASKRELSALTEKYQRARMVEAVAAAYAGVPEPTGTKTTPPMVPPRAGEQQGVIPPEAVAVLAGMGLGAAGIAVAKGIGKLIRSINGKTDEASTADKPEKGGRSGYKAIGATKPESKQDWAKFLEMLDNDEDKHFEFIKYSTPEEWAEYQEHREEERQMFIKELDKTLSKIDRMMEPAPIIGTEEQVKAFAEKLKGVGKTKVLEQLTAGYDRKLADEKAAMDQEVVSAAKQLKAGGISDWPPEKTARWNELTVQLREQQAKARRNLYMLVKTDKPSQMPHEFHTDPSVEEMFPGTVRKQREAVERIGHFLSGALADATVPKLKVDMNGAGRPSYTPAKGPGKEEPPPGQVPFTEEPTMFLGVIIDETAIVHEWGHHIEQTVPGVREAAHLFLKHRVGDEKPRRLDDFSPGYGPHEFGRKDRFDEAWKGDTAAAYYVGKTYHDGATEVISMGLEKLYEDPAGFATNDPEYCAFILGILDGSMRHEPFIAYDDEGNVWTAESSKLQGELAAKVARQEPGKGGEIRLTYDEVQEVLSNGVVGFVSAGRNPNNPADKELTDEQVQQRYDKLKDDLVAAGLRFVRVKGKYGEEEDSFLVMVPEAKREEVIDFGKRYNQDSVLFSDAGKNYLIYTTGPNAGKEHRGEGWEPMPDAEDFYTEMPLEGGKKIKFQMKLVFDDMFEAGKSYRRTPLFFQAWFPIDPEGPSR